MIQKINVLELMGDFSFAGGQRTTLNFCKYIDKNFFNVFVGAYINGGPFENEFKKNNIPYVVFKNAAKDFSEYVVKNNIQVVHFHRSGHFVPIEFKLMKSVKEINPGSVIIETNIFGKFDAASYKYIDCSLQISKMMLNERYVKKAGYFDSLKTKVLYNPVDLNYFVHIEVAPEELNDYKKRIGLSDASFIIGKLGRPSVAKWGDLILDMMPYLVRLIPNVKLIIQSAPPSRERRIARSALRNNIIFLDQTINDKELALFYKSIDVYVHASKIGESFGMTLAEAGCFKKPVVVNSTPRKDNNQLELVEHMKTGIIANTPQTFARAVARLYNDKKLRKDMGEAAFKKIIAEYNPEMLTKQLEKIFIEKLFEKGSLTDIAMKSRYDGVCYRPNEADILKYKEEYKDRLTWDYGTLSTTEKVANLLRKPYKLYWKIRDFVEHKFN